MIAILLRKKGDRGQVELAIDLGVSPQYLGDVLANRRDPGKAILSSLGIEKIITYQYMNGKKK